MMKFGIEIECIMPAGVRHAELAQSLDRGTSLTVVHEGYNHSTRSHWKVVTDASLGYDRGAEVVSPILYGEDGLNQMREILNALDAAGCTVNRACGVHVHFCGSGMDMGALRNLAMLYVKFEAALDSLVAPSRRQNNNGYCRSMIVGSVENTFERIRKTTSVRGLMNVWHGERQMKLNFTSMVRHGTVEVRHHSGSLDADKLTNWVKCVYSLVQRAQEGKAPRATVKDEFETLMKIVSKRHKGVVRNLRKRRNQLAS